MTWRLYTDGSCEAKTGAGGWAYILYHPDGNVTEEYGASTAKTNALRMELCAVLGGLLKVPDGSNAIVHTDNAPSAACLTLWKTLHQPVVHARLRVYKNNKALVGRILSECRRIGSVKFVHVLRDSCPQIKKTDALANAGRFSYKEKKA